MRYRTFREADCAPPNHDDEHPYHVEGAIARTCTANHGIRLNAVRSATATA